MAKNVIATTAQVRNRNVLGSPNEVMYQIAGKLLVIMKNHIGRENAIEHIELFKKVYNIEYDSANNNHWMWDAFLSGGMRLCRLYSKCFIVPVKANGRKCSYCVVEKKEDTKEYVNILKDNVVRIKKSIETSQVAAEDHWSKKVWHLEPKIFNEQLKLR
jgi:hypothetical protein